MEVQCTACAVGLALEEVEAHALAAGHVSAPAWACGLCSFKAAAFTATLRHCLRARHDLAQLRKPQGDVNEELLEFLRSCTLTSKGVDVANLSLASDNFANASKLRASTPTRDRRSDISLSGQGRDGNTSVCRDQLSTSKSEHQAGSQAEDGVQEAESKAPQEEDEEVLEDEPSDESPEGWAGGGALSQSTLETPSERRTMYWDDLEPTASPQSLSVSLVGKRGRGRPKGFKKPNAKPTAPATASCKLCGDTVVIRYANDYNFVRLRNLVRHVLKRHRYGLDKAICRCPYCDGGPRTHQKQMLAHIVLQHRDKPPVNDVLIDMNALSGIWETLRECLPETLAAWQAGLREDAKKEEFLRLVQKDKWL